MRAPLENTGELDAKPQVYVNVSGGIAEVTVTRGDVEVIHIDWDNFEEAEYIQDLIEAREEIDKVAMPGYRKRLLADIDDLIQNHPDYDDYINDMEGH